MSKETPVSPSVNDLGDLTIGAWFRLLRPAQLWGLLGVEVALIVGAFSLGLYINSYRIEVAETEKGTADKATTEAQEETVQVKRRAESDLSDLKTQLEGARTSALRSEIKQEFLIRYLRYETAKLIAEEEPSAANRATLSQAEVMFIDLVSGWWKKQNEFSGSLTLNPAVIRKGLDPTNSRVEFPDGSSWPIPTEIKRKVLEK